MLGILTAGRSGADREFSLLGMLDWRPPATCWASLADLERPGTFVFSDGTDWELRVTDLDSGRRDAHGRRISNTLVLRGNASDERHRETALSLAASASDATAMSRLEAMLATELSEDVVESWYDGTDESIQDRLTSALEISVGFPPKPMQRLREAGLHVVSATAEDAQRLFNQAVAQLLEPGPGLAIWGTIYLGAETPQAASAAVPWPLVPGGRGVLVVAQRHAATWEPVTVLRPRAQTEVDPNPKARVATWLMLALLVLGLVLLLLTNRH